jgi:hypothetical protein
VVSSSGYFVAKLDDGVVEIREGSEVPGLFGGLTLAQAFRQAMLIAGWK